MNLFNRSMFNMPYSGIIEVNEEESPEPVTVGGYKLDVEIANEIDVFEPEREEHEFSVFEPEFNVFEEEEQPLAKKKKKKTAVDKKIKNLKSKVKNKK